MWVQRKNGRKSKSALEKHNMYHFTPPPLRLSSEVTCVGVGGREGLPVLFHLAHTPVWPLMFLQCSLYVVATCSSCHSLNFTLRWLFRVTTRFSSGHACVFNACFCFATFLTTYLLAHKIKPLLSGHQCHATLQRHARSAHMLRSYNWCHLQCAPCSRWMVTHHWVFNFFTAPST